MLSAIWEIFYDDFKSFTIFFADKTDPHVCDHLLSSGIYFEAVSITKKAKNVRARWKIEWNMEALWFDRVHQIFGVHEVCNETGFYWMVNDFDW